MSENEYKHFLQKLQNLLVNKNIDVKRISNEYFGEINKDDFVIQFNGKRIFAFLILIKISETEYYQLIWNYYKRKLFSKKIEIGDSIKTVIYSTFANQIINIVNEYLV